MFVEAPQGSIDELERISINSRKFLQKLPEDERTNEVVKVLVLTWDMTQDELRIRGTQTSKRDSTVTKRIVLHTVAEIYDPLGLPTTVIPFMARSTCRSYGIGLSFDDPLPPALSDEWHRVSEPLKLSDFRCENSTIHQHERKLSDTGFLRFFHQDICGNCLSHRVRQR